MAAKLNHVFSVLCGWVDLKTQWAKHKLSEGFPKVAVAFRDDLSETDFI